jgi:hypothetical protein
VDTLVGILLMEILDHLTLALGCGMGVGEVERCNALVRMLLICGAALLREVEVAVGPPVTTRLPLAVYLTAASWGWDGVMSPSFLLRISQIASGFSRELP